MSARITIVGLGPGHLQHLTVAAHNLLQQTKELYLRTAHHPVAASLATHTHSFDAWYDQTDNFNATHNQVAAEIVRLGRRPQGVVYGVPGHPNLGEATVPHIRRLAGVENLPVTIIPGLSLLESTVTALNIDTPTGLQWVDATELAGLHHPPLETGRPALLTHLRGQKLAARLQHTLLNSHSDNLVVSLIQPTAGGAARVWSCRLEQLDTQPDLDKLSSLYLPAQSPYSSFSSFQQTIAHLRAPDGCPWDRKQSHQSLRPYLLEETYEVLEALDADDPEALAEELGDLLLQIVLHTQIAIDTGEFKMSRVIDQINRKLIRRHPHVFGNVVVNGVEDVATNWEAIKQAEKAASGRSPQTASALDGIPPGLPALAQAMAVSKKAVRVGFEWANIEGVLEKIIEEAKEVAGAKDLAHLESEIGDLLFSVVNLARWHKIEPESALRATNARFTRRFKKMEALAADQGRQFASLSIDEMDSLWAQAKNSE